jgi:hypothetical protein
LLYVAAVTLVNFKINIMIDAKDLRIGNLIYIDNGEKPIYRYQITAHDIEEIEGNGKDCFEILLTDDFL